MSSPSRPELRTVGAPEEAPAEPAHEASVATEAPARDEPRPRRGLLIGALVVLAVLFLYQVQRAAELEGQVALLHDELASSRRQIELYEHRTEVVRSHIDDLATRVGALQQLVDQSPARSTEPH